MPQADDGDATDTLLDELTKCFVIPIAEGESMPTTAAWNEQRTLIVERALRQLIYPKMAKEALETAVADAHAVIGAECAHQLHKLAFAAPYRIEPAQRQAPKPGKKRKPPWVPNVGAYYDRKARVVGATVLPKEEMERGGRGGGKAELLLVAIDENGELLDHIRCRWLLTNIRLRGGPRPMDAARGGREAMESRASELEISRKMAELARLEDFFREVGCEAIALGISDMQCRSLRRELQHIAFAMALRTSDDAHGDQMADKYYRCPRPDSDAPLEFDYPQVARSQFESRQPFRCVLVDESITSRWAATAAAAAETPEMTTSARSIRTALSSARMLQVALGLARPRPQPCPPPPPPAP